MSAKACRTRWSVVTTCAALALASCARAADEVIDPTYDAQPGDDAALDDDLALGDDATPGDDAKPGGDAQPGGDATPSADAFDADLDDAGLDGAVDAATDVVARDRVAITDRVIATDRVVAADLPVSGDAPCATGQARCGDRCVSTASDPAHCGGCDRACPAAAHATAVCGGGRCGVLCEPGRADCDGDAANGCEVDVSADARHCGACVTVCSAAHATAACEAGACAVGACAAGWGDCDGAAANGCETSLTADEAHCGACRRVCAAGQTCVAGACQSPVFETFDTGAWPWSPWTLGGGTTEYTASAACAHDGARGLAGPTSGPRWYYRSDVTVGAAGQRLSAWVRANTASARVYLGFGATSAGAWSLVFAPNTRQLLILNDASWGFTTLAQATATIATSTWYRLEVTFGASNLVTGRLYSAAGVVVATVSTTVAGLRVAGPALFAFGSCVDTLESR